MGRKIYLDCACCCQEQIALPSVSAGLPPLPCKTRRENHSISRTQNNLFYESAKQGQKKSNKNAIYPHGPDCGNGITRLALPTFTVPAIRAMRSCHLEGEKGEETQG